jgi:hypothetical protein
MRRQQRTLDDIFREPVPGDISWREVESMFRWLGAEMSEGRGSRVRIHLNGVKAVLHRPHPEKEIGKATVRSIREFLVNAGVR